MAKRSIASKSYDNYIVRTSNEQLLKLLIIGDIGTGKTSFIRRYVHRHFTNHYRPTIGVDFALKIIKWNNTTIVRLQLWDIAGQERFTNMTRAYYKEADGAFIVFDVSKINSFEAVLKWKRDLDSKVIAKDGSNIPSLLLANKSDLCKEKPIDDPNFLDQFCRDHGFNGWFYTSPKKNINIDESANFLVSKILEKLDGESKNILNKNNYELNDIEMTKEDKIADCMC